MKTGNLPQRWSFLHLPFADLQVSKTGVAWVLARQAIRWEVGRGWASQWSSTAAESRSTWHRSPIEQRRVRRSQSSKESGRTVRRAQRANTNGSSSVRRRSLVLVRRAWFAEASKSSASQLVASRLEPREPLAPRCSGAWPHGPYTSSARGPLVGRKGGSREIRRFPLSFRRLSRLFCGDGRRLDVRARGGKSAPQRARDRRPRLPPPTSRRAHTCSVRRYARAKASRFLLAPVATTAM